MFFFFFFFFFENYDFLGFYKKKMGSTARPRYIGLREISERDILELYCINRVGGV